ncbi:hypothetical protein Hypma_010688 [Hypsizygus marmoreus]|uniref:Uncharacterized protein n=1 Tax=Hypsizygus marmoreus TaxID=39966 RepID=A0A369JSG6_HYPMA|nr:hypothetical protein Hypma_010688 [Hypsizygus marmoreus]
MSPETITHGHAGDAASVKVKTKFNQLRRQWLGHRSEPVSRCDASTSTTDLVQSASRIPDDEEHTFTAAAIPDDCLGHRSTGLCRIAHLPVEILGEIFIHCLPLHECDDRYVSPRIYEAPMLLCHVCCHWRHVALSMTVLWSSFSASCWFNIKPDTFAIVQCFLDRSQNHPLSIEFGDDTSPSVRQLLFANFHRWRNVSIELDDEIVKELLGLPVGVATQLESLSMRIGYDCEATLEKIPTILPLFPRIRRLHFDTIQSHKSLLPNIPWTQLTHIRLQCEVSLDECVMSLGRCEKAEHIQIAHIVPSGPVRSAPVTLPYLAHFDVVLTDDIGMFLDHFILPSLHTLQYTTGATTRRNVRAIESLAQRSSCTLEVLHIRDIRMLEDDLIGYLSLPCLRSLQELDVYNIDNILT